jgi:NhaA family Na+:H+ antiporter
VLFSPDATQYTKYQIGWIKRLHGSSSMDKHSKSNEETLLPQEPIHRFLKPLHTFLHVEAASGVVLLVCALAALIAANSAFSEPYLAVWKTPVGVSVGDFQLKHALKHWINDGLMAIFFFVVGLEVKREMALGELRELRRAALPLAAAIGGMVTPAAIYLALQFGAAGERGWGVPMATDIAFVVGCMAILGRRVPASLRVILLSLAIVDDIGAILVIALGYTQSIHWSWLAAGIIGIVAVILMQRSGVRSMGAYTAIGVVTWLGFHESGIHATIAGVVLGLLTPARPYLEPSLGGKLLRYASDAMDGNTPNGEPLAAEQVRQYRDITREIISPLEYLVSVLHPWVAFLIMPIFALANAGVPFQAADVTSTVSIAVILGLVIGKPAGILLLSWLAITLGLAMLPEDVNWRHMAGGGFLAGIGFTMALFIAGLAFDDETLLRPAKVGILLGSIASAGIGMVILSIAPARSNE